MVCGDYGGVYGFHVCFDLCIVYGVGICIDICGVVCFVVSLFPASGCCYVMYWVGVVLCWEFCLIYDASLSLLCTSVICSLLMLVSYANGDNMVETYFMGLVMALYVGSFLFSPC